MGRGRLVVVGDALLDRDLEGTAERLAPDAPVPVVADPTARPRPGGAGLAAALAAADGREVTLVCALAEDEPGRELARLLVEAGVEVVSLRLLSSTPEKVRIRSDGRTLLRLDRGGERPGRFAEPGRQVLAAVASGAAVTVSDYGWGITTLPVVREALAAAAGSVPLVWDPHPKSGPPVPGARIVKPNRSEVGGGSLAQLSDRGRRLRSDWRAEAVAITLGPEGALVITGDGPPTALPAVRQPVSDPCGAGDRFAVSAALLLMEDAGVVPAVAGAVEAASAFVGAGGASAVDLGRQPLRLAAPSGLDRALKLIAGVRARGGRVVATGGCFDLLHAGHVSVLQRARALGDCLIVCMNSDASTRRLKGSGRPVVGQDDRTAVLAGLAAVDAVVTFDEDTPETVLARLRPDIFVKGGDYADAELPERRLLAEWGGEVVLVPFLAGRSTSRLLEEVGRHAV